MLKKFNKGGMRGMDQAMMQKVDQTIAENNLQRIIEAESSERGIIVSIDAVVIRDYLLEPRVEFGQVDLSDLVEVVALYPQRRINVHVYDQPGRQ